jgi:predicted nucleotidyltransferase component of viral defense system
VITLRARNQLAGAYRGSTQATSLAYLELAQEHFLHWAHEQGLFKNELCFKGGTAIRKFYLGMQGRFSTDLDFSSVSDTGPGYVLDALQKGFDHEGMRFRLYGKAELEAHERHGMWVGTSLGEDLGPTIPAKIDFALQDLTLPVGPHPRAAITSVDARALGFEPASPPLVDIRENLAEKLARVRRVLLAKDIYDLGSLAVSVKGEGAVIHELVYLKVYGDVVLTSRGLAPFGGGSEYRDLRAENIERKDELGAMVRPTIDWKYMLAIIRDIYGAAVGTPANATEKWLAACSGSDKGRYGHALADAKKRYGG